LGAGCAVLRAAWSAPYVRARVHGYVALATIVINIVFPGLTVAGKHFSLPVCRHKVFPKICCGPQQEPLADAAADPDSLCPAQVDGGTSYTLPETHASSGLRCCQPSALLQPLLGLTYNLLQQGVRFKRCAAAQRQAPLWQRVRTLGYQAAQHSLSVWLHSRRCTCRRLFGTCALLHLLNGVPARAGAEKGPSSRRGRADTESAEGDSASSVSASTLASLRDDFGEEDLADEHPLERLIDALYEKRCVAAPMHAPPQEQ